MKKIAIITILTLSTTMASAKPADAWFFIPAIPTVVSWVIPTSISWKAVGSYIGIKQGVMYVTHSSGKRIGTTGNSYIAGTIK